MRLQKKKQLLPKIAYSNCEEEVRWVVFRSSLDHEDFPPQNPPYFIEMCLTCPEWISAEIGRSRSYVNICLVTRSNVNVCIVIIKNKHGGFPSYDRCFFPKPVNQALPYTLLPVGRLVFCLVDLSHFFISHLISCFCGLCPDCSSDLKYGLKYGHCQPARNWCVRPYCFFFDQRYMKM